ncbi:MAG: hypothetical protein NTV52_21360 [Acidobacteria bacterium]|nr:hypothetical protein [Acidobacteriota bacterium]
MAQGFLFVIRQTTGPLPAAKAFESIRIMRVLTTPPARAAAVQKEEHVMAVETLEAEAHELIGQPAPQKLAAVVQLMKFMLDENGEGELNEETRQRLLASKAYFDNGGQGVPMEDVLADFGLTMADFPAHK